MRRPPRRDLRRGKPRTRVPPPDQTGLETQYLEQLTRAGVRLRVRMSDGNAVEGRVRECSPETITLDVEGGGPVMIRKTEIRYVEELRT